MSCEGHRLACLQAVIAAHPGRGLTAQDAELIYQTHRRKAPGTTYEKFTAGLEAGLQVPEPTIAEALPVQESAKTAQARLEALRAEDPELTNTLVKEAMARYGNGAVFTHSERRGQGVAVLNEFGVVTNLRMEDDGELHHAPVFSRCPQCGSENVYRQERADGSEDETQGECDACQHRGPIEGFHLKPWDAPKDSEADAMPTPPPKFTGKEITLRVRPADWETLSETLDADAESGMLDDELRADIQAALATVQPGNKRGERRLPADAWATLAATLEADADSASFDRKLRGQISRALGRVQVEAPALTQPKPRAKGKAVKKPAQAQPAQKKVAARAKAPAPKKVKSKKE